MKWLIFMYIFSVNYANSINSFHSPDYMQAWSCFDNLTDLPWLECTCCFLEFRQVITNPTNPKVSVMMLPRRTITFVVCEFLEQIITLFYILLRHDQVPHVCQFLSSIILRKGYPDLLFFPFCISDFPVWVPWMLMLEKDMFHSDGEWICYEVWFE